MLRVNTNQQEIEYKGLLFPFNRVKEVVRRSVPAELIQMHCVYRKFNTKTGEIERKYAFDAVFEDLAKVGILQSLLDDIIQSEFLD